ncbi:hypothetical protein FPV67DRAFT_110024 [Lyophyllum atratum]|nr:hypothetical protein FPV67DRAFT_110024 [Lyophyllum atratum]
MSLAQWATHPSDITLYEPRTITGVDIDNQRYITSKSRRHATGTLDDQRDQKIMASYPLIIAQFDLPNHPRRTEHWRLVALQDKDNAHEFELAGNWSNFQYVAGRATRFGRLQTLRGGCQVGTVPIERIEWLKTRLAAVEIVHNNLDFDGQNWILNALKMLRADGMPVTVTSEVSIRKELALEKERWDAGEDTVEDRLFA